MKKNLLSASLLILAAAGMVWASARGLSTVTLTAQDDGNVRASVVASCVSTGWTSVVAIRANRRLLKLRTPEAVGGVTCIGTDDQGAATCTVSTPGTELGTGDEYSDASEAALYCRTSAGSGTVVVKGFDLYDNRD